VLVGRLRGQPHVVDQVLTSMSVRQATEALRGAVGPDTLLCTDGSGAMRGAAKALGVTSKSIAVSYGGRVVEGVYHVQTVNSYHERLQSWLSRGLRGVATKYLPNYLAWMRLGVVQGGPEAGTLRDFWARPTANQYLARSAYGKVGPRQMQKA
jgi:hypothetical protein